MAGHFKVEDAHDNGYRVTLVSDSGELVAVSGFYPTKRAVIAGIDEIREIAGTGRVVDRSRTAQPAARNNAVRDNASRDNEGQQRGKRSVTHSA